MKLLKSLQFSTVDNYEVFFNGSFDKIRRFSQIFSTVEENLDNFNITFFLP
jgi:hypothetical protein